MAGDETFNDYSICTSFYHFINNGLSAKDTTKEEGSPDSNDDTKYEDYVYTKYDLDVKDKVKLGEEDAENTFVLAFDYSCPWCHKWMDGSVTRDREVLYRQWTS